MTQDFRDMLYLLGAAVNNSNVNLNREVSVKNIRELAISQGVYSLVFPELEKICDMRSFTREFLTFVADGIRRNTFYLNILSDMEKEGISFCLLKGAAISEIYPVPEYRISGDTDILINSNDEKRVVEFLKKKGCTVEKRDKNEHHSKVHHPVGGLMELHVRLYSIPAEKILFSGKVLYNEEYSRITVNGQSIPILGINDGLIYLTAHYIKHFVNKGGGVRQMLDLLVYIEYYKNEIDFVRYHKILKDLRYDKLIAAIKSIGAKYWGFDYPITDEELAERILTDCEDGGIFGGDNENRNGFYKEYYLRRNSKNVLEHKCFMAANAEHSVINRIFVGQKGLTARGYTYAKNKLLVPIAWIHRFIDAVTDETRKRNTNTEIGKEVRKRLKLMQDLEMIE